jgi:hypothetical protein
MRVCTNILDAFCTKSVGWKERLTRTTLELTVVYIVYVSRQAEATNLSCISTVEFPSHVSWAV